MEQVVPELIIVCDFDFVRTVTKEEILETIRETASKNGGVPLGQVRFAKASGIGIHEWRGKYWVRWSEALTEAGFSPNLQSIPYDQEVLLAKLGELVRTYHHFPTYPEVRLARVKDETFPGTEAFYRLGQLKSERLAALRDFAVSKPEYADILQWLPEDDPDEPDNIESDDEDIEGFVYMAKMGKYYKIGMTTSVPRRHRQLALELPEELKAIHSIRTDDPSGIEAYWKKRFAALCTNGEWFALTPREVKIFKRRKFM